MGDKLLLKLNIDGKPIANKYYEGKMKRTLKRGLKDLKSLSRKRLEGSHLLSMLYCAGRPPRRASHPQGHALQAVTVRWYFFESKRQSGLL